MGSITIQLGNPPAHREKGAGLPQLLTVTQLCDVLKVSPSWIYQRTMESCREPLPVVRFGPRSLRFDLEQVFHYIHTHERHWAGARLESSDGSAPINGKGHFKLAQKRFQAGSVRLRKDVRPPYWEGFYRDDIITEEGKKVRKRRSVYLGTEKDLSEKAARQKLGVILEPINSGSSRPRKMMTFRGFIQKYRTLKLVNKKGTTVHGYETNIRAHYLPEFGPMQLSEITPEAVQQFINQKASEGKAVQTLRNLKWGLSSIFVAAVKYGYISSNPARNADLPPEGIKEEQELPTGNQLLHLIDRLEEPIATATWLIAVTSIRPEEIAFKWKDLNAEKRELKIVRAVNQGELHTPKYHRMNRPIRLTEADVERLLALKERVNGQEEDWMFPNRIKNGSIMKSGPIWHETLLARRIQPVARELGLPHITWRLLRHWGATQMVEANTPIKAVQQRLGHSRPNTVLIYYARVLDKSADSAASLVSGQLSGAPMTAEAGTSIISSDLPLVGSAEAASLPQQSL
jgi:integrase